MEQELKVGEVVLLKRTNELGVISQINSGITRKRRRLRQDGLTGEPTGDWEDVYTKVYIINTGEFRDRMVFGLDELIVISNQDKVGSINIVKEEPKDRL